MRPTAVDAKRPLTLGTVAILPEPASASVSSDPRESLAFRDGVMVVFGEVRASHLIDAASIDPFEAWLDHLDSHGLSGQRLTGELVGLDEGKPSACRTSGDPSCS